MRACGTRYTEQKATHHKLVLNESRMAQECRYGCEPGIWHVVVKGKSAPAKKGQAKAPQETGFSDAAKLIIRTRAGHGNPEDAHCEMHGGWLGIAGGQCHHRQNRQMGGSRLRNGVANGGLACGNPLDLTTCHGKATALDPHMIEAGWVLKSGQDPLLVPVALAGGVQSGIWPVWLTADGQYTFDRPAGAEVAA